MELAPQTAKCFASGCDKSFISNPEKYGTGPVDTSSWIRDAKYGWLADLDRWFCLSCFARVVIVRQQLPIAIQELHAYALLSGAVSSGVMMGEPAELVIHGKIASLRRVAALRAEEAALIPTTETVS